MYAAPELSQVFGDADHRADIYSIGCILHDIHGSATRFPFQQLTADGPFGPIIKNCTATQPRERFQSVDGLRKAIELVIGRVNLTDDHDLAEKYLAELDKVATASPSLWNSPDASFLAELLSFLVSGPNLDGEELVEIYYRLTPEILSSLYQANVSQSRELFELYCCWAQKSSFDFRFCDAVGRRLQTIYQLSENTGKLAVVKAMAELAARHNRYNVMGFTVALVGRGIDNDFAQTVAIELTADQGFRRDLVSCIESQGGEQLHRLVAKSLRVLASGSGIRK